MSYLFFPDEQFWAQSSELGRKLKPTCSRTLLPSAILLNEKLMLQVLLFCMPSWMLKKRQDGPINFSCIFVTKYVNEAKPRYAPTTFLLGDILDVWLRGKRWNAQKKKDGKEKKRSQPAPESLLWRGERDWVSAGRTNRWRGDKKKGGQREEKATLSPTTSRGCRVWDMTERTEERGKKTGWD